MNRCEDCKYFTKETSRRPLKTHLADFGLCDNPIFRHREAANSRTLFLYFYWIKEGFPVGSEYNAGFYVHKGFGCIGFKERIIKGKETEETRELIKGRGLRTRRVHTY